MTIKVRYEKGVLKPLQAVSLQEEEVYEIEVRKVEDLEKREEDPFTRLATDAFFRGYGEKDAVYDKL